MVGGVGEVNGEIDSADCGGESGGRHSWRKKWGAECEKFFYALITDAIAFLR